MKKFLYIFPLIFIFLLAFFYRFRGLSLNTPFWVDEFSSVAQSELLIKHGLSIFSQKETFAEFHNIGAHLFIALSTSVLGKSEFTARLPFAVIGSIIPILVYIVSKKLFSINTAWPATLFTTFSYWHITWSRQARGYVLQQLFVLLALTAYTSLLKKFTKTKLLILIVISLFGLLTHTTFILVLGSLLLHFLLFHKNKVSKIIKNPFFFIVALAVFLLAKYTGQIEAIFVNLLHVSANHPNNLAYYHSFLWREQTVISLLSFFGVLILFFKEKKYHLGFLLLLPIIFYLIFVSFLFFPYVSRYLLPIFPLFYILSGVAVANISKNISKKRAIFFSIFISMFIVINGDTFVLKPKAYYSVNHDMREIALIDYHKVYAIINTKRATEKNPVAIVDTWPDRSKWYLGDNIGNYYIFRWSNEEGTVNGLTKNTIFKVNTQNEKYLELSGTPPIKVVVELSDLHRAMSKYSKGFIWIDDASMPADVIQYVERNFFAELYLDHYPLDDNPYSIWPGALYSWGFVTENPFYLTDDKNFVETN